MPVLASSVVVGREKGLHRSVLVELAVSLVAGSDLEWEPFASDAASGRAVEHRQVVAGLRIPARSAPSSETVVVLVGIVEWLGYSLAFVEWLGRVLVALQLLRFVVDSR